MTGTTNPTRPDRVRPRASPPVRVALVLTAAVLVWLAMGWLHEHAYPHWPRLARHATNAGVVCLAVVPTVLALRRWLDRRPIAGLGLTGPRRAWWPVLAGALSWLLPAAAGAAVCLAAGWSAISTDASAGRLLAAAGLLVVLVFAFEALPEELIFRGYLYRTLGSRLPPWLAVIVQAVLFAGFGTTLWVVGNGWSVLADRAVLFTAFGIVLGCLRVIAGNLWTPIGYHLCMQVAAQLMLGRYAEVEIRGEAALTLLAFGPAFLLAPWLARRLLGTRPDWRRPEPDPPR